VVEGGATGAGPDRYTGFRRRLGRVVRAGIGVRVAATRRWCIVGGARVNLSAILSVRQKTAGDDAPAEESAV
jgi:hypothetical protein